MLQAGSSLEMRAQPLAFLVCLLWEIFWDAVVCEWAWSGSHAQFFTRPRRAQQIIQSREKIHLTCSNIASKEGESERTKKGALRAAVCGHTKLTHSFIMRPKKQRALCGMHAADRGAPRGAATCANAFLHQERNIINIQDINNFRIVKLSF